MWLNMKSKSGCCFLILVCFSFLKSFAQKPTTVPKNGYGLEVITNEQLYHELVSTDSSFCMVPLTDWVPGAILDLRYAGKNNFMHGPMYPVDTKISFLRLPAAVALKKVEEELSLNGMHLKIFDAYRPFSVTVKFWEAVHDERYVANPKYGSGHNKGLAVDLTITDSTGKELNMGTCFDNFTDTAYQAFAYLPKQVLDNRSLLRTVMEKYGFIEFVTEWWHYSFKYDGYSPLYDLPFTSLSEFSVRQ